MFRTTLAVVGLLSSLASCNSDAPNLNAPVVDGIELQSSRKQLIRLAIDLTGAHPSKQDLDFIEQYPQAYDDYVDKYLQHPRFSERMSEIWNRSIRTRTGETFFDRTEADLGMVPEEVVADSIGDEPLALLRHVIENDLPFSEMVTADYTMADPIVAAMWSLEYPEGKTGWQPSFYTDGRPHAGVMTSTTMWSRYPSAGVNSNRHRANTISRIFLCDDYLSRPVSFSRTQIDTLTSGDPEEVIQTTQACQSCHSTLDPFASHFFGFWWEIDGDLSEQTLYRPEDEQFWREQMGDHVSPAFYGIPTQGIDEMAQHLAEDPRFASCAVRTVFDGLTQRNASDLDRVELTPHIQAFVESNQNVREAVRSIVMSPEYRAAHIEDERGDRIPVLKSVTPAQLETIILEKTGYRWSFDGRPALQRNIQGLAVLAGGTDGRFVNAPNYDPSIGLVFVQERLAQAAAWHVVRHDLADDREEDAILLRYVTRLDTPENNREAFVVQLEQLYVDVIGVPLDRPESDDEESIPEAPEVAELIALWKRLYSVDANPERAWAGVTSVVLRDPMLLFY